MAMNAAATAPLLFVFAFCVELVAANGKLFHISWNTTNSIFRIDNTDHVFDLNKDNPQFVYDQVNIICPLYPSDKNDDITEKYIIYNVSKEEYDTCRITNPNPKIIAVCDKPHKLLYFTITFRPFSPQPGGLEFFPGQDYYFISTSSKDDLHRRIGGWCSTNNMKLIFRVCCKPGPSPTPAPPPPPPPPTRPRTTTTTTTTEAPPPKKTPKPDKALNDVLKSEELSFSTAPRASALPVALSALFALFTLVVRLPRALPTR